MKEAKLEVAEDLRRGCSVIKATEGSAKAVFSCIQFSVVVYTLGLSTFRTIVHQTSK